MDDYRPAKNLMTMCFTYYYHGTPGGAAPPRRFQRGPAAPLTPRCLSGKVQPSPSELLDRGPPPASLDLYLNKANSWLSGKKDAAERLLKTPAKTDVKGFFGGLESKLRSSMATKTE